MTNLITEARELCERATPGPWMGLRAAYEDCLLIKCDKDEYLMSKHDVAFVARSRTLIPELCDALEKSVAMVEELLKHPCYDICKHCKNQIVCCPNTCDSFEEGKGGTWDGEYHPDFRWSCRDFNYATCGKMKDTPCNGCFDNDCENFELG